MVDRNPIVSLLSVTAMVTSDTGLPDPDNPNNDLRVSDQDVILVTDDDEDSDEQETVILDDYQLLPIDDTGDSNHYSSEDEAYGYQTTENLTSISHRTPIEEIVVDTFKQISNEGHPSKVDIEMDSKKINEVKEAMSKIILPPSSIPEWANNIPEDEWKKHLLNRLQSNQEKNK